MASSISIVAQSVADVFVDGKLRGTTPLILNDVLIGERKVTISKDGFETIIKSPNVVEDQKSDIIVALQSIRYKSKVTFSLQRPYRLIEGGWDTG